jgi:hypothetical protein
MHRHEIPTHLNVEDRVIAGLSMRQLMIAVAGLSLAYAAFSEPPVPFAVRLVGAGVLGLTTGLAVLWRPAGRPLEDWAFILLRYWALPRVAVWRPRIADLRHEEVAPRFEVVVPEPAWAGEPGTTEMKNFTDESEAQGGIHVLAG